MKFKKRNVLVLPTTMSGWSGLNVPMKQSLIDAMFNPLDGVE